MRSVTIWISLFAAFLPARAASEPVRLTIDNTVVQLDPDLPVLGCAVIETSGNGEADDQACARAREQRGDAAPTMSFRPDREGRFVDCRPYPDAEPSPEFRSACASELERIQHMRAMVPIDASLGLQRFDPPSLLQATGRAEIRIGIDREGRPTYCLLTEPRDNPRLERRVCSKILRRARFRPARDLQGRPIPSVYRRTFIPLAE